MTQPRVLDNEQGVGDYLYRAEPSRLVIIDINGRIAYYSEPKAAERKDLDLVISQQLDRLDAHGGVVSAQTVAGARSDAVGKDAVGFWLPRVEYFAFSSTFQPQRHNGPEVAVIDARGQKTMIAAGERDDFIRQRALVARLFPPESPENSATRPVVLIFGNARSLPAGTATANVEKFYLQQKGHADCYLVYTPEKPGQAFATSAYQAKTWLRASRLTIPCLVDSPEREVSFAYGANSPRLMLVALDANKHWEIRYAGRMGNAGVALGLKESAPILHNLTGTPAK